jgi:hypothetical protein
LITFLLFLLAADPRAPKAAQPTPPPAPASAAVAEVPTVAARVNKKEFRVGDVVQLIITSVGRRETPVNLPRVLDLAPFSELDETNRKLEEKDLGDGKMRRDFLLFIAAYEPGEVTVPAVELTYLGQGGKVLTTRTAPVNVKITSLLANEPEPALKENAPPVRVLERDLLLIYVAGALAASAFGALAFTVIRRRLRVREAMRPAPPPRPAHEIALEKLDRLGARGLAEDTDLRPFFFELSEIVREYLGARYGFDSLELTTEELMAQLHQHAGRELIIGEVLGWLSGCDLVKFAKSAPSLGEARGSLETAIRIVATSRPPLASQEAVALG